METIDIEAFWDWFSSHSFELRCSSKEDLIREELEMRLHRLSPDLFFEICTDDEVGDFIITPQGKKELFPMVEEIVFHAPLLPGWVLHALKPARGFDFELELDGRRYAAKDLHFHPLRRKAERSSLGLRVAVPGLSTDPASLRGAKTAILLILDIALGERRCVEEVAHVEVVPAGEDTCEYMSLTELPRFLDWSKQRS